MQFRLTYFSTTLQFREKNLISSLCLYHGTCYFNLHTAYINFHNQMNFAAIPQWNHEWDAPKKRNKRRGSTGTSQRELWIDRNRSFSWLCPIIRRRAYHRKFLLSDFACRRIRVLSLNPDFNSIFRHFTSFLSFNVNVLHLSMTKPKGKEKRPCYNEFIRNSLS